VVAYSSCCAEFDGHMIARVVGYCRRHSHFGAAAVFAATLAIMFFPVLTGSKVFTVTAAHQGYVYPWAAQGSPYPFAVQSDQAELSMPMLAVQQRAYDEGELPHIDLYSYGGGTALYADFSTGQAYPPRMAVAALFHPVDAHFLFTVSHLFAAGMFTFLLGRRLGYRWLAALFAGLAWMLSSWTTAWMHLAPVVVISAAIPASLWAVHRLVARPTLGASVTCGVVLGACFAAGHALFGVVAAAVAGCYGLALTVWPWRNDRPPLRTALRSLGVLIGAASLGGLIWAAALLPAALTVPDVARGGLSWEQVRTSQLASMSDLTGLVWQPAQPLVGEEINTMLFVGVIAFAAALVGAFTRSAGSALGRGLVIGAALAMLPGPGSWLLFHTVPLMDVFRPYDRFAIFLGFGVAMLAGAGLDRMIPVVGRWATTRADTRWRAALWALGAALVVVNSAHLMMVARAMNPAFAPRAESSVLPTTPFTEALLGAASDSPTGWPGRAFIISARATPEAPFSPPVLWAATGAWVGVEVSGGYNSTMARRSQQWLRTLGGEDIEIISQGDWTAAFSPQNTWAHARVDLLARSGFDLIVAPPPLNPASEWASPLLAAGLIELEYDGPDGVIYRIVDSIAGPHDVDGVVVAEDDRAAWTRFADSEFECDAAVILDAASAESLALPTPLPPAAVSNASRSANGYEFTVTADARTLVVVPVNWSSGWAATGNGEELRLLRGNFVQVVLEIPAGTTEVSLRYRSPGFTAGLVVSSVTIVALSAAAIVLWVRRRRLPADDTTMVRAADCP
jgi:hypothetical protein